LGDPVLRRATRFFGALAERGQLTSVEVSGLLGLANQRSIGANMTVSLSKRVKALDLPQPWTLAATPDGERTVWRDRAGIAERMHVALRAEAGRRGMRLDLEGS
jgi:surface antigen